MEDMNQALSEVSASMAALQKGKGDLFGPFMVYSRRAMQDGVLSGKTKALIAVALSVGAHCKWCVAMHVKGALDAGASDEEIMESCAVAVLMGGGPSLMYVQLVMKAIEEYKG